VLGTEQPLLLAVQNANTIVRRGGCGSFLIASSVSSSTATPLALSSAPLWM
jgi:predicted metal-dependent TIM-barrel fold hydrolase